MTLTATRTDVHRPGALVPTDYSFVDAFDAHPEDGDLTFERRQEFRAQFAPGFPLTSCTSCSKPLRYGLVLEHEPTGHLVTLGQDCAESLEVALGAGVARLADVHRRAEGKRESHRRAARLDGVCAENPGLAEAFDVAAARSTFVADVREKAARYGSLSERQVAAVLKVAAAIVEEDSRPVAPVRVVPALPLGRTQFVGTVLSSKVVESLYGATLKVLVETDEGWRLWGTAPRALENVDRGARVTFAATVEPSKDDAEFGFFSRPTKARNL